MAPEKAETIRVNINTFTTKCGKYKLNSLFCTEPILQALIEEEHFIVIEKDTLYVLDIVKDEGLSITFCGDEFSATIRTEDYTTRTQISRALNKIHTQMSWNPDGYLDTSDPKVRECIATACLRRAIPILKKIFTTCPIDTSVMDFSEKTTFEEFDLIADLQNSIDKFKLFSEDRLPRLVTNGFLTMIDTLFL